MKTFDVSKSRRNAFVGQRTLLAECAAGRYIRALPCSLRNLELRHVAAFECGSVGWDLASSDLRRPARLLAWVLFGAPVDRLGKFLLPQV